jgi:hypothetical protein
MPLNVWQKLKNFLKGNVMQTYLENRINELRATYRATGEIEFAHRINELMRAREHLVVDTIGSQSNSEPDSRWVASTGASS